MNKSLQPNRSVEQFLTHHKRNCPANKGRDCTCGLYQAREEIERLRGREAGQTKDNPHCDFCAGTHGWHEEDCPATDPANEDEVKQVTPGGYLPE
jgi:hypothetical protein